MTATLRLYEATEALQIAREFIEEHQDEIIAAGGELPQPLAELLDLAEGQFAEKCERVALFVRELLATAAALDAEAGRLNRRRRAIENAAKALKDGYLKGELLRAERTEVKGTLVNVRIQKNSQPAITIAPTLVAQEHWGVENDPYARFAISHTVFEWDRGRIVAEQRAGHALPNGITCETGVHVRIS